MNPTPRAILLIAATALALLAAFFAHDGHVRRYRVALATMLLLVVLVWAWDAAVVAW